MNKMSNIIQKGHETLRQIAEDVAIEEIGSEKIQKIIGQMKEALDEQDDGVAIAAPQINESLRIFVVSHKVFKKEGEDYDLHKSKVFINPEIVNVSKDKEEMDEGCLSVRWWYGKVKRSKQATVRAYDIEGKLFEMGAGGLVAQIFQHEIDHLEGILFTDKAERLEEIPPEKQ